MGNKFTPLALGVSALIASVVYAEVSFEWAIVGNPGNPPDPLNTGLIDTIGTVEETYLISRNEVTNAQYVEFLNAVASTDSNGLFSPNMESNPRGGIVRTGMSGSFAYSTKPNMEDKPVNYVSYLDAMRFVNWLQNGQPSGSQSSSTTESGAYLISDGLSETRMMGADFFIPSENEWYKAAYHQPASAGGDGDDYWLYPTATNSVPSVATADSVEAVS